MFHSLDPSPFREKDLDDDAEEFIVAWAKELPEKSSLKLIIHLEASLPSHLSASAIQEAIRNYFNYSVEKLILRNKDLVREGFINLIIGLTFLSICLITAQYILLLGQGTMHLIIHESLIIGGWVAMWRPMQIFLYDRWPIKRTQRLYERLGKIDVSILQKSDSDRAEGNV